MEYLPAVEIEYPKGEPVNAAIIWLHGLGADGNDFAPIVPQLDLPAGLGVRFIFPHAPSIPVTINNGFVMPAWYDIKRLDVDRHVDTDQLKQSASWVHDLIEREIERGVPSERIIVAGFSQGGAVSFEAALTYPKTLAGIMALSTYFATGDSIEINPIQNTIPIMIGHGSLDPVVAEALGSKSVVTLQNLGFNPEYFVYTMEHAVCPQEIVDIGSWIGRTLGAAPEAR
ncbi:MAG: carboxylesterase [Gammaproteobacteria bacterium]|nr:carboxylesterase [Gammaproteobacteria bacterium]MBU13713.1 carboxylesterase [Gammaproteobacteria bacterium]|tara:strand:+ start:3724 stop:4407 length:684 start_codon:yes stop_codon:yes gene_type:complete